ncbi:MAG: methyltransferase domain-containing protein, partial [Chloroflexi bacterium]|nr:methyltransferase domain-containing protein [Chloroflexota bacterium]
MRRVLDVGCGTGKLGARLKSDGVAEVIGIEVSEEAAAEARLHLDQVYVADIEDVDLVCPDGYFDCIIYSGVLEHLRDPWHILSRHRRALSDDGCIVCLLPNVQHHTVIENLLQGFWTYQPEGQLDATHYRFFTAFEIARMLAATGFVTQEFRGHKLGERSERFEQIIQALKPLGLLSKDFEHLTDSYIFLLRACKAAGWDLVSPGAPAIHGGLAQEQAGVGYFTGERAVPLAPNMDQEVMREHWARYRFALAKVEGRRVLDAACGTGYGSRLLAEKATFVQGVDVSPESVLYAGQHYRSPNVAFSTMDIRYLALASRSFDVVVSFETIEHIREADAFLGEVCRVLKESGEFIVSTPLGGAVGNPFHLAYYQRETFGPLLRGYFNEVTLYYQRGSEFFVTPVSPLSAPTFTGEYAIAICRGQRWSGRGEDDTPEGRNARAERLILEGRLDEATRDLHEALRLRPDYSVTYNNLGTIAFVRGRHAEAGELFATAVGLDPNDEAARDNLADLERLLKAPPLVSIVILTHNELPYTRLCVESIERYTPERHELVFVDNASSDGTLDYLRSLPGAVVIANDSNRGFAAGCNQGIAHARGRYVLLLNNDVIVTEGWLTKMIRWLETDPRIGIVGPMTNYVVGPQRVQQVPYGEDMSEMQAFARRFAEANAGKGFATNRAVGFCLLMKREVVEKIGG